MKPPVDPALAARTELATPFRYHLQLPPPPVEPWWQRAWDAVAGFIDRLFSHVHVGHAAGAAIGDVLVAAIVALAFYLVVRFALILRPRTRRTGAEIEPLFAERDEQWLAREAFAAAERGEIGLAVRLLFGAAVMLLDLRGAIHDDASATVGELRRAVRPLGDVVAVPFGEIASAYVTSVYAERPVEPAAWSRAYAAYRSLRGLGA
ncbi:MAG TPA: hypothetical protein VIN40_01390 [Candidatus Tyrphobacter sp.]